MTVGSILEIYTTYFGWAFYGILWELFVSTGVIYIPFVVVIYKSWINPIISSSRNQPVATSSLKQMQIHLYSMMGIVLFAGIPLIQLDLDELTYPTVICNGEDTEQVEGGATETTYDNLDEFVAVDGAVNVPLVWYLGMAINNGISRASISQVSCFEDIDGLDYKLRNLTLEDEPLREEFTRFANECFVPVKSKFVEAMGDGQWGEYTQERFNQGLDDDDWEEQDPYYIGSRFYQETRGYYRPCDDPDECGLHRFRAKKPVDGFAYDVARDIDYTDEEIAANVGRPYCDEWWINVGEAGLRDRLVEAARDIEPTNLESVEEQLTQALAWASDLIGVDAYTEDDVKDIIIKRLMTSESVDFTGIDGIVEPNMEMSTLDSVAAGGIAGVGAKLISLPAIKATGVALGSAGVAMAKNMAGFYTSMYVAKKAAPMVQAIVLMVLYLALPIFLVATTFSFEGVFSMLLAWFVIRFFTVMWVMAELLDAQLYAMMFPDATIIGSLASLNINRLILDIVLSVFYLVGPIILLGMVAMAGTRMSFASGDGLLNPVRNIGSSAAKASVPGKSGK